MSERSKVSIGSSAQLSENDNDTDTRGMNERDDAVSLRGWRISPGEQLT